MKNYLALILIVSLMLPLFGCSKVQKPDVWDGSIEEAFADGDGSEKKPYAQTNCLGCASLPADHGFDASVWDLTDLSNPKVK